MPQEIETCILDGEMIVLKEGKPCVESVIRRLKAKREQTINRFAKEHPSQYGAFDIIYLNDKELHQEPLSKRLSILKELQLPLPLFLCPAEENGQKLFEATKQLGLEGIVSKNVNSKWKANTRSEQWKKIKNEQITSAWIMGVNRKNGSYLLFHDNKEWSIVEYAANPVRREIWLKTRQIETRQEGNWIYLEKPIACEVKHQGFTSKGKLRSPYLLKLELQKAAHRIE